MDWSAITTALATLLATLSGLTVVWRDQSRPFVQGGAICILNPIAVIEQGVDEVRHQALDGAGDPVDPEDAEAISNSLGGLRRITLSVQVELLDQRVDRSAITIIEQIRSRLSWPSSLAALHAAGLALQRVGGSTVLDYVYDNRNYGRAACDVFLGAASNTEDAPTEFIETVVLTTEVTDEAGTVLPSPPNLTEEELP